MVKSGEKWGKVGKGGKSGEKWGKVGKKGKSGVKLKKWEKVAKTGEKWKKWRKVGKSGEMFSQNGRRRPFWMTENHFRSHFSPDQCATLNFFFTKWPPAAILDDRKSLSIAVFAISDQYAILFFFEYFFHFGSRFFPKSIGTYQI